uniref:ETAA1 activator of ATR kinase a n=1 Tax=Labrus bergylta TaxID=56723 RepID=A0A3Q3GM36_9LABR
MSLSSLYRKEFQTHDLNSPTRIPRSRAGGGFSGESPHNDSDVQQDIIWDATSPSPNRLGKYQTEPRVAEPTLQQWIGDSAAIPCTPDVQAPKPKKKSPRPNGVDDLLKLAKQFDFNMFRRDEEEEVDDPHQQSLELLSEDMLDFENGDQNDFSPSLFGNHQRAEDTAAAGRDIQAHLDLQMEDDLDLLFDGPTQHVSGNLSQVSQVKHPPSTCAASGKTSASSRTSGVSTTNTRAAPANDEFEDDWENDDLLNDSLVLEMTQNPQSFSAPTHCSTQKPAREIKSPGSFRWSDSLRQRSTFKLESNPHFSIKTSQTDTWTNSRVENGSKRSEKDPQKNNCHVLAGAGSQQSVQKSNTVKSDTQKQQSKQRTNAAPPARSFPLTPAAVPSHNEAAAISDLLDDNLNSFFSSDPVWDDPADDDLLCEMCENVENQIQSAQNVPIKQTVSMSTQRAALQLSVNNWDNRTKQPTVRTRSPSTHLPSRVLRLSFTCFASPSPSLTCFTPPSRVLHLPHVFCASFTCFAPLLHMFCVSFTCLAPPSRVLRLLHVFCASFTCFVSPSCVLRLPRVFCFSVMCFAPPSRVLPSHFLCLVLFPADLGKCSAAEIELKKQQAMERRRQRLQATQNLPRAPT